ncbi:hypothetical protein [Commensalibacter nepenthis]|uniref:PD-(D/E)XK endonuclease-like domain-containing protein n=1 Tax=Commensalibacter nepenthis TaxID=3043872 RepID=A0ABT6Q8Q1_9PROT|nr:hypothetical protein [Commensalibacter sp. TBRC 10068]MDI2112623.1 hypothetical protein [Commensalibacter sp. TBRC 10068]
MSSVTSIANKAKQPQGGYLPLKTFQKISIPAHNCLQPDENIHASLIGMTVHNLTHFILSSCLDSAFYTAEEGSYLLSLYSKNNKLDEAYKLKNKIRGLDDKSIINACKLAGYECIYRAGIHTYKPINEINPNKTTIHNIRTMVENNLRFFTIYGPLIGCEYDFQGGYTQTITKGNCDFVTDDGIWDIKTNKTPPTNKHSLQILIYYLLGIHSDNTALHQISKIGIYNPRLNNAYIIAIKDIPKNIITSVEQDIIKRKSIKTQDL